MISIYSFPSFSLELIGGNHRPDLKSGASLKIAVLIGLRLRIIGFPSSAASPLTIGT
jgi:hypothetical protein